MRFSENYGILIKNELKISSLVCFSFCMYSEAKTTRMELIRANVYCPDVSNVKMVVVWILFLRALKVVKVHKYRNLASGEMFVIKMFSSVNKSVAEYISSFKSFVKCSKFCHFLSTKFSTVRYVTQGIFL